MEFLKGQTALVTGGTRGIGRAIAVALRDAGARVAICGRTGAPDLGPDVLAFPADVSRREDVERLFAAVEDKFGGLDILVNNAGVGVFRSVKELTPEEWHRIVDLNLSGVYYCCRSAIPLFERRGGGYIIQISSLAGVNAFAGGSAYNASKFGLNGFSEAIMQDLRHDNIRVSYVMPGSVDTDFGASGRASWKIAPEDIAQIVVDLLRIPARTLVSRVEVRPSKPPKK